LGGEERVPLGGGDGTRPAWQKTVHYIPISDCRFRIAEFSVFIQSPNTDEPQPKRKSARKDAEAQRLRKGFSLSIVITLYYALRFTLHLQYTQPPSRANGVTLFPAENPLSPGLPLPKLSADFMTAHVDS
jgi:hypothetical protein